MNAEIFGQPARFFDTRNKSQMLSPHRSAQPASHKKLVAVLPAAARDPATSFNKPAHADRSNAPPPPATCFSMPTANGETLCPPRPPHFTFRNTLLPAY